MYVRDVMTTDLVTISSDTSVLEARKLMSQKNLRRLPVVDDGKLIGLVTVKRLEKTDTPEALSTSMWDVAFNLVSFHGIPVKRIMQKELVTVTPDMTVEETLALAQSKKVGSVLVVEGGDNLVGIITSNDLFSHIVNPVLGIGAPGCRVEIIGGAEGKALEDIISTINKHAMGIITLHVMSMPKSAEKDIVVHLDSENAGELFAELESKGYKVSMRCR